MVAHPATRQLAGEYLTRLERERGPLPPWYLAGKVVEEAGEAYRAWFRLTPYARTPGTAAELAEELADVVLAAYQLALRGGLDLDRAIVAKHAILMSRDLG